MKNLLVFTALCMVCFAVPETHAQDVSQHNTMIRLQIDGQTSTWVRLQQVQANTKSAVDSVRTDEGGNAVFAYDTRLASGYYEIVLPDDRTLPLLLDKDQTLELQTDMRDLILHMQVSGNLESTLLYDALQYDANLDRRFQAEIEAFESANGQMPDGGFIDQLRQRYFLERADYYQRIIDTYPDALYSKYTVATQRPNILYHIMADTSLGAADRQEMMLSHFWDNIDFSDRRLLNTPVAFDKLWEYLHNYVPNETTIKIQAVDLLMSKVADYPEWYRFFATWIAEDYLPPFTAQMDPDALYIHMVDHYLTQQRAFWADSLQLYAWQLRSADLRVSLVGMQGESFEAKDPDGGTQSIEQIAAPYIALFFYHAECDHCIEETPRMVEQYHALKANGLEVVAIAMDTPKEEWTAFIEKNRMDCINVTDEDNDDIQNKYFVRATPEVYLLNAERTIIGKHLRAEDISTYMQLDQMRRTGSGGRTSPEVQGTESGSSR